MENLNNIPQITQTYNGANSCTSGSSLFSYKNIIPYCTVFMLRSIRRDRIKHSEKWTRGYFINYNCFNLEDCMFLNIQTMSLPQVVGNVQKKWLQSSDPSSSNTVQCTQSLQLFSISPSIFFGFMYQGYVFPADLISPTTPISLYWETGNKIGFFLG